MIAYEHMIEVLKAVKKMSNKIDIPDIDKELDDIIWLLEVEKKMDNYTNIIFMMARMGESKAEQAARNLKLMMSFYKGTENKVLVNENDILTAIEALDEKNERYKPKIQFAEIAEKAFESGIEIQVPDTTENQLKKEMRQALSRKFFKLDKEDFDIDCEIDSLDTVISNMLNIYQFLFPEGES